MLLTAFPVNAFAAENTDSKYDQLIELACEVFPEYEDSIRGEHINTYALPRSTDPYEVIYRESRKISDTETLSISMLASGGTIVLLSGMEAVDLSVTHQDIASIGSIGKSGTASFQVALDGAVFELSGVQFVIYNYDNDSFTSYGTVTDNTFSSYTCLDQSTTNIKYSIHAGNNASGFFTFRLYFDNNQLIAIA